MPYEEEKTTANTGPVPETGPDFLKPDRLHGPVPPGVRTRADDLALGQRTQETS